MYDKVCCVYENMERHAPFPPSHKYYIPLPVFDQSIQSHARVPSVDPLMITLLTPRSESEGGNGAQKLRNPVGHTDIHISTIYTNEMPTPSSDFSFISLLSHGVGKAHCATQTRWLTHHSLFSVGHKTSNKFNSPIGIRLKRRENMRNQNIDATKKDCNYSSPFSFL